MSEIVWICLKSRFPLAGPKEIGRCTAPTIDAAIATFAARYGRSAQDFARSAKEFQTLRPDYLVQSAASARLGDSPTPRSSRR